MKINVIDFNQKGNQMYVGVMRVADVLQLGKVDVWKQDKNVESGYQRAPESSRAKKIAGYLKDTPKPLMPTSILLSHRGVLEKTQDGSMSVVDVPPSATLWIVDGQHRMFGFQKALDDLHLDEFKDYLLPVVIVEFPTMEEEANQFRIINETMKRVRTDLARRILAQRVAVLGVAGRREMQQAGRMWETEAVEITKAMNSDADSPWHTKIQAPGVKKTKEHAIRELSFTTSLKPLLNAWPYKTWPRERIIRVLKAYWNTWKELLPEGFTDDQCLLLKTAGVFSQHLLVRYVLEVLRIRGINDPGTDDFKTVLSDLGS